MRPPLFWCLCAALLLSAAAVLWPEPQRLVVAMADRTEHPAGATDDGGRHAKPLPPVTRGSLEKASFDPFVGVQPPPPAPPAAAPAPKPFVGPLYVPPPSAPSLNYRYLGQMVDPAGQRLVYLAGPQKDVAVSVGTRLDEGYVVEAIAEDGVRLHYAPLDARVVIPLPSSAGVAQLSGIR